MAIFAIVINEQRTFGGELDDEIDRQLSGPSEPEISVPRYFGDPANYVNNINLLSYTTSILNQDVNSALLTFPSKNLLPIHFNLTTLSTKALFGNLALLGLGAYLLSFIPVGGSNHYQHRNDGPDLGYGLQRDSEIFFDEFGNEIDDYDYQYPDSFDFDSFSSFSSASEPQASLRKANGEPVNRQGTSRSIRGKQERKGVQRANILQDLSQKFWSIFGSPVKRADSSATTGFGFQSLMKRYDDYWKRRRSGIVDKATQVHDSTFSASNRNQVFANSRPHHRSLHNNDQQYRHSHPHSHNIQHSSPSWQHPDSEKSGTLEDADVTKVYRSNYGEVENARKDSVEYVYSQ